MHPSHEVLQVLLRFHSNLESSCDLNNSNAISMQMNSHRQNKVIEAVKKWNCFQF